MTPEQLKLARHALGLPNKTKRAGALLALDEGENLDPEDFPEGEK